MSADIFLYFINQSVSLTFVVCYQKRSKCVDKILPVAFSLVNHECTCT